MLKEIKEKIREFYNIDGINVINTLLLVEKLLVSSGYDKKTSLDTKEILRPLFIYLDRHKELLIKTHLSEAMKEVRGKIEDSVAHLRKNREVNYHQSYNEGKIDLADDLLASLNK